MYRQVRRLRLTCAREEHARHGRVLLEDALRTASFGDEGRLILVRRLNLGRVPLRANATQWSRRLEESYRQAQPIAVAYSHPSAHQADAVYFATSYEPWLELARRTAAQETCTEWFWRPAVPGWRPGSSTEATLRLCFQQLAALGGLPLTLLLAARVPDLVPLMRCLREEDVARLSAELGRADDTLPALPAATDLPNRLRLHAEESAMVRRWGVRDLRVRWLAAARLARPTSLRGSVRVPPPISPPQIEAVVQAWLQPPLAPQTIPEEAQPYSFPSEEPLDRRTGREMEVADRLETAAGGLFLAVPLLVHAGLPEFLAGLPTATARTWPWHWFRLLLRHGRIAADDPMFAAIALDPEARSPGDLGRWLRRANRLALRATQLNLRPLVRRPALVSVTATHVDVFFRTHEADVRIRRAGLDTDPGWVPWLGRVIAYHFNRED